MTDDSLSPVKRALLEIRQLKAQLAASESARHEPIAIVGAGLRLPGGVRTLDGFAELLRSGSDAVTTIPRDRWSLDELFDADPDAPGKMFSRHGAFIEDVRAFDAEFFGIAPREAASMDPQQRLLLEVAWEALENAGHAPSRLAGTKAGVFIGIGNGDYGRALLSQRDLIDAYFTSGTSFSVAAGRISYFLGVHGPSLAIDTACSGSLVAVHLAIRSLRSGECDLALTGGVNLILTPEININFSKARMMAPDGRCKTFDAAADGYVRGEGCGVVVLRRLSDALADRDPVLAVLRGSAVNQDGRSGGLTAPNGPAQSEVIHAALADAGIPSRLVSYVEAHGTGTALGDPIEVGALATVFGPDRGADHPLVIGSVKTNLGHLEAAAGITGLLKAVVGLGRREIPPSLHFNTPNPHIDWASLPFVVPTSNRPWVPIDGRRVAGVSSFGFSGTNAHVIVEEAPPITAPTEQPAQGRPVHLLVLSARDEVATVALAERHRSALPTTSSVADYCYTAAAGRTHFGWRMAALGSTAADLVRALETESPRHHDGGHPKVAFLFTGQGAQSAGMGADLYHSAPVFRQAIDDCFERLSPFLPMPPLGVVFPGTDGTSPINETRYAQPLTFAFEYGLARLWQSWGIEPTAVMGHSLGEYAAACVAGVFSLDDAVRLVADRGRLSDGLPHNGAMAAVFAPRDVVAAELTRHGSALGIAAYNGPEHHVISGPRVEIEAALASLERRGIQVKLLRIPHAAHSGMVEPMLEPFGETLRRATLHDPVIPLVSNVSGRLTSAGEVNRVEYWLDHLREPVRFAESIETLAGMGITHCIEIGPHPVLIGMGMECLPTSQIGWLPSVRRDKPNWIEILESLKALYLAGASVDWEAFDAPYGRRRLALPTYPFRERRHWVEGLEIGSSRPSRPDAWIRMEHALDQQVDRGPLDLDASLYPDKWRLIGKLVTGHVIELLRSVGLFATAGERHTVATVVSHAGITPAFEDLTRRWLDRLVRSGHLERSNDALVALQPLDDPKLEDLWGEVEAALATNRPLFDYLRHCGGLVPRVVTGQDSPLETLFPGGRFDLAEGLYERSATMRYINGLAAAACQSIASSHSGPLRVLEIGAGIGGTTSALLPVLDPDQTRYWYTEVSPPLLDHGRARFGSVPFMSFGLFDLDRDPVAQGYPDGSFDLVVSANAVHVSRDLRGALERIGRLLVPGGVLLLVEATTYLDWFDMTTGLFGGWHHYVDDLRDRSPLLDAPTWIEALGAAGFVGASAWPKPGTTAEGLGQHVLVAKAPGQATRHGVEPEPGQAVDSREAGAAAASDPGFQGELEAALPQDRLDLLRQFVRDEVMRVLRLDPTNRPSRSDRLMDLGFDSLMAVQLRGRLTQRLKLPTALPATLMFDHPTIDAIAEFLLQRMGLSVVEAPEPSPPAAPDNRVAEVAAMSDAEVEALLLSRLENQ